MRSIRYMRLCAIGTLLVLAMVGAPASATQPVLPTCDMRYPAHRSMQMEALLDVLRAGSIQEGQCAADHLSRFGARTIPSLEAMLHSEREEAREMAVAGLSALGSQALPSVPKLEAMLDDQSAQVRWWVFQSFVTLKPRSQTLVGDLLLRLARSPHGPGKDDAMLAAIASLGELPPEALRPLTEALAAVRGFDQPAIDAAIDAISHVQSPRAMTVLVGLIGRDDAERGRRAEVAVGHFGVRALPALLWRLALADSDAERDGVRLALSVAWQVAAVPGLADFYQTDQVQLLRQLGDADSDIRGRALDTLDHLVPAFSAFSRSAPVVAADGFVLAKAMCDVLLALDDGAYPATDAAERQRVARMTAALRATQKYPVTCPLPIY